MQSGSAIRELQSTIQGYLKYPEFKLKIAIASWCTCALPNSLSSPLSGACTQT